MPAKSPLECSIESLFVRYKVHLKGYKVWIFGSRARGTEGPRSDYDIGFLGASPLDLALFFELQLHSMHCPHCIRLIGLI